MSESSTRPLTRAGNHADDSAYGGQKFDVEKTNKVSDDDIAPELQLNRKGVGSWFSAGYHMGTTIAVPAAILPLPYAFSQLSWGPAIIALLLGTCTTYYSSWLLAGLFNWNGQTYYRYRDLVKSVFGRRGFYAATFFQQIASLGNNLAIAIVAGQSMKALYITYNPDGDAFKLPYCIIVFGFFQFIMSQLPDLHSLRFINALSNVCTLVFSTIAIGMSIHNGHQLDRSTINYEVPGSLTTKIMGVFLALGSIAFAFGDTILPEIQATVKEPAILNMRKGITMAYCLISSTYFTVAISGYWAFGQTVLPYLLNNLTTPTWPVTIANIAAIIQITGCYQVYCRPTYEYFEMKFCDVRQSRLSKRNLFARFCITLVYNVIITFLAALIPFFGDFVALVGAIGFIPMDFLLPIIMWLKVRRPHRWWAWTANITIIVFYSIVAVCACVGAIRQIHIDVGTYKVFADLA